MKHKFCVIFVAFRMFGGTAMPLGITALDLETKQSGMRFISYKTNKHNWVKTQTTLKYS